MGPLSFIISGSLQATSGMGGPDSSPKNAASLGHNCNQETTHIDAGLFQVMLKKDQPLG